MFNFITYREWGGGEGKTSFFGRMRGGTAMSQKKKREVKSDYIYSPTGRIALSSLHERGERKSEKRK